MLKFINFKNINKWDIKNLLNTSTYDSSLYITTTLSKIILDKPKYGSNSKGIKKVTDTRYVRITDINEDGTLNDKIVSAEKVKDNYLLRQNDFLIARSGSVGRTFLYHEKYGRCIYAGYLIKFILNQDLVNPYFLLYYTKSNIFKTWINGTKRTTGVPNINSQEYLNSPIILPSLNIQNNIANHIGSLKDEIQSLKEQSIQNKSLALKKFENEIFNEA